MTKHNNLHFRQPVHSVYGGAQLFSHEVTQKLAKIATKSFQTMAPNAATLCEILQEKYEPIWEEIYQKVTRKLTTEAVEDLRIDFEDGYGSRSEAEEDGHAKSTAMELAKMMKEKNLPPFIGIRIKAFEAKTIKRSKKTLELFLQNLLKETQKNLPENFVITLPKVANKKAAAAFEKYLAVLEKKLKLKAKTLRCELMVETAQAVLEIRSMVLAMKGRCRGVHFGTYDYTASLGIISTFQSMTNPTCDFAKHLMQMNLHDLPVFLSDGATTLMPVGSPEEIKKAWKLSYDNNLNSLRTGFYQGWDLHPGQIPMRYVAIYSIFLKTYQQEKNRSDHFLQKTKQATLTGNQFDDAATYAGLVNFFNRGVDCGALDKSALTFLQG